MISFSSSAIHCYHLKTDLIPGNRLVVGENVLWVVILSKMELLVFYNMQKGCVFLDYLFCF